MRRSAQLEATAVEAALAAIDDETMEDAAIAAFEQAAATAGAEGEAALRRIAREVLDRVLSERRRTAETLLATCEGDTDELWRQFEARFAEIEARGRASIELRIESRR
jgi:hypothetical protein